MFVFATGLSDNYLAKEKMADVTSNWLVYGISVTDIKMILISNFG